MWSMTVASDRSYLSSLEDDYVLARHLLLLPVQTMPQRVLLSYALEIPDCNSRAMGTFLKKSWPERKQPT